MHWALMTYITTTTKISQAAAVYTVSSSQSALFKCTHMTMVVHQQIAWAFHTLPINHVTGGLKLKATLFHSSWGEPVHWVRESVAPFDVMAMLAMFPWQWGTACSMCENGTTTQSFEICGKLVMDVMNIGLSQRCQCHLCEGVFMKPASKCRIVYDSTAHFNP